MTSMDCAMILMYHLTHTKHMFQICKNLYWGRNLRKSAGYNGDYYDG